MSEWLDGDEEYLMTIKKKKKDDVITDNNMIRTK